MSKDPEAEVLEQLMKDGTFDELRLMVSLASRIKRSGTFSSNDICGRNAHLDIPPPALFHLLQSALSAVFLHHSWYWKQHIGEMSRGAQPDIVCMCAFADYQGTEEEGAPNSVVSYLRAALALASSGGSMHSFGRRGYEAPGGEHGGAQAGMGAK